jgi:hypothetical protein
MAMLREKVVASRVAGAASARGDSRRRARLLGRALWDWMESAGGSGQLRALEGRAMSELARRVLRRACRVWHYAGLQARTDRARGNVAVNHRRKGLLRRVRMGWWEAVLDGRVERATNRRADAHRTRVSRGKAVSAWARVSSISRRIRSGQSRRELGSLRCCAEAWRGVVRGKRRTGGIAARGTARRDSTAVSEALAAWLDVTSLGRQQRALQRRILALVTERFSSMVSTPYTPAP